MMNGLFKVPHSGVILISSDDSSYAEQKMGHLYIDLSKVIYFRNVNEQSGLIHLVDMIDIELTKEWYDSFVDQMITLTTKFF